MYRRGQKVLVGVERDARHGPESRNFDEVHRQGYMADCHAASGGTCECHPRHHHCPPQVGSSAAVADEKAHFFEEQATLSGGVESWGCLDAMEDVIAGGCDRLLPLLPPPHLRFPLIRQNHPLRLPVHQFHILLRNFHRGLARYRFAAAD